jgi:hypothetical protein
MHSFSVFLFLEGIRSIISHPEAREGGGGEEGGFNLNIVLYSPGYTVLHREQFLFCQKKI